MPRSMYSQTSSNYFTTVYVLDSIYFSPNRNAQIHFLSGCNGVNAKAMAPSDQRRANGKWSVHDQLFPIKSQAHTRSY